MIATLNSITAAAVRPDPIALAIEAHRTAWASLAREFADDDEPVRGPAGETMTPCQAAHRAEEKAWTALLATRPTDADGLARLIRYIADASRLEVLCDARDLGRNLAEAAESVMRPAAPAEPDPVLTLIEAHRTAYAAWDPLAAVLNEAIMGSPEFAAAEAAAEEPGRREQAAMTALMAARPTTAAGLWALTAYLPQAVRQVSPDPGGEAHAALDALREGALQLGLAQASTPAAPVPAHPDAALLALGLPFLAVWRDEGAADPTPDGVRSEAQVRCSALADRIAALPATTPEGLGIKALAFACYSGGFGSPAGPMSEPDASSTASDDALLWQIQAGAARILAGEAGAGGEAPAPAPQDATPPPALDLSGCSVTQLARLHEVFQGAYDHLLALGQLPCFLAAHHSYNPAGEIIEGETDRLGAMVNACVSEIARRDPAPGHERDDALRARVVHELRCNGGIHDPDLLRDLAQVWGLTSHIVTEASR